MKWSDRVIRRCRFHVASQHLTRGIRLLDVGCADASFAHYLCGTVDYFGIDPRVDETIRKPGQTLLKGRFPRDMPDATPFQAITMLATLEHVADQDLDQWAAACAKLLAPGGKLILTLPSPNADFVLGMLKRLHVIDGIALEEHHGFKPAAAASVFERPDFELALHRRFQWGLNNLIIFRRRAAHRCDLPPASTHQLVASAS